MLLVLVLLMLLLLGWMRDNRPPPKIDEDKDDVEEEEEAAQGKGEDVDTSLDDFLEALETREEEAEEEDDDDDDDYGEEYDERYRRWFRAWNTRNNLHAQSNCHGIMLDDVVEGFDDKEEHYFPTPTVEQMALRYLLESSNFLMLHDFFKSFQFNLTLLLVLLLEPTNFKPIKERSS